MLMVIGWLIGCEKRILMRNLVKYIQKYSFLKASGIRSILHKFGVVLTMHRLIMFDNGLANLETELRIKKLDLLWLASLFCLQMFNGLWYSSLQISL